MDTIGLQKQCSRMKKTPNSKKKLPTVLKTKKMMKPLTNQTIANPVGGEAVHAVAGEAAEVAAAAAAVVEAEEIVTTATQAPETIVVVGAMEVVEEAEVAEINKIINEVVEAEAVAKAIEDDNKTKTSLN